MTRATRLVLFALLCVLPLDAGAQLSFGAGAPLCTHAAGSAQLKTAASPSNPCGELTNGYIARVTDGLSAGSCASGGGTAVGLLQYSTATSTWSCISGGGGGSAPDATTSVKGILQLTGDLSGTATSPSVVDNSHNHDGTTISALDAADTTTGTFAIARIPAATTGAAGAVQLAGDFAGTSAAPRVTQIDPNGDANAEQTFDTTNDRISLRPNGSSATVNVDTDSVLVTGNVALGAAGLQPNVTPGSWNFAFEGATGNPSETYVYVTDPTADRNITIPDYAGTVLLHTGTDGTNVVIDANRDSTPDFTLTGTELTVTSLAVSNRDAAGPGNYVDLMPNETAGASGTFGCAANSAGHWRVTDADKASGTRRFEECDGTTVLSVRNLSPFRVPFAFTGAAHATLISDCLRTYPGAASGSVDCSTTVSQANKVESTLPTTSAEVYVRKMVCRANASAGITAGDTVVFEPVSIAGNSTPAAIGTAEVSINATSLAATAFYGISVNVNTYISSVDSIGVRMKSTSVDTGTAMTGITGTCELYGSI